MPWRKGRDPLFRGDDIHGVATPDPRATIEHVLYLGGAGRATKFQSTTETEDVAAYFAGRTGKVYRTSAPRAASQGVAHLSQVELKGLLRGKGHGAAKSSNPLLVMQARRYVEQWAEHLLDFSGIHPGSVARVAKDVYEP